MKLMDEKGKLFGKLNLIDLLVLVILIAALVLVATRFLLPGEDVIGGSTKLTYTATVTSVEPDVYEEVLRQWEATDRRDQLMANGELLPAYVTGITAVPHIAYGTDTSGNSVRSVEENGRVDVTFTVEAQVADPVVNKVGTQEVRVGKNHIMKTTHFEFPYSTIITCDWE